LPTSLHLAVLLTDDYYLNATESVAFALSTQIIQQWSNFDPTVFANQRQAKIDVVALRRQ